MKAALGIILLLTIAAATGEAADSGHGVGWEAGVGIVVPMGATWRIEPVVSYRTLSRDVTIGATTTLATLRAVGFDVGLTRRF